MQYENFLRKICTSVQEKLGSSYEVSLHQVLKNNGSFLDSLSIRAPGSLIAPAIYLNAYYEEAEKGLSLSVIADQITLLHQEQPHFSAEEWGNMEDFEKLKDRVVFKLVNKRENELLLTSIPYYPYLDLAIIFYLIISESSTGQMTSLIRNEHLSIWQVSVDTLWALAEKNTPLLFPASILPIESALASSGIFSSQNTSDPLSSPVSLYVLSNQYGINGAACLLYKNVLKNFAAQKEDDLVVLPSSIHEVLLTPYKKAFSYEDLNEMICLINSSDVSPEDRLSNHAYLYSREQDCLFIPSVASDSTEKMNPQ